MRVYRAVVVGLYAILTVLQARCLVRVLVPALRRRRIRRRAAAERELFLRLEVALKSSDAGWTQRL